MDLSSLPNHPFARQWHRMCHDRQRLHFPRHFLLVEPSGVASVDEDADGGNQEGNEDRPTADEGAEQGTDKGHDEAACAVEREMDAVVDRYIVGLRGKMHGSQSPGHLAPAFRYAAQ